MQEIEVSARLMRRAHSEYMRNPLNLYIENIAGKLGMSVEIVQTSADRMVLASQEMQHQTDYLIFERDVISSDFD